MSASKLIFCLCLSTITLTIADGAFGKLIPINDQLRNLTGLWSQNCSSREVPLRRMTYDSKQSRWKLENFSFKNGRKVGGVSYDSLGPINQQVRRDETTGELSWNFRVIDTRLKTDVPASWTIHFVSEDHLRIVSFTRGSEVVISRSSPANLRRCSSEQLSSIGWVDEPSSDIRAVIPMPTTSASEQTSDCSGGSTIEIVSCHNKRYEVADHALNQLYSAAQRNVSESERILLRDSQRAWIRFRDSTFRLLAELEKDSGSFAQISIENFRASFVERRVSELREIFSGPGNPPEWLQNLR